MDAGVLTMKGKSAAIEEEEDEEVAAADAADLMSHEDLMEAQGPIGAEGSVKMIRVSSKEGQRKKLTKKQLKEIEYAEKRAELVRLGIMPE
jgi:hypothetical protein